ncbi:MAG: exopolysaccharide biosynthesis polyprenyl glycosylphosphotransferase [Acidimicrobiales bacterium]
MRTQIDNAGVRPSGLRRRPSPPRITWLLLVSDLVALLATGPRSLGWLIGVALFPILAGSAGYYRSRLNLLLLDDLPGLLGRLFAASAIGAMAQQALRSEIDSNWWSHLVLGAILVVGFRAIVYASVRLARVRRLVNHPTLIVGLGDTGLRLANALVERTEYGLRPVGFFDSDPKHTSDLPVFGEPTNLADAIAATGANVVILAFSSLPETELVKAVRVCERLDAEIFYVPRLFDLHSLNAHDVEEIWAVPLVRLRRSTFRSLLWGGKRLLDILAAGVSLLVLSPLLLLIAALVKWELGSPILFRQERVSLDHRHFTILKFRSLPAASSDHTDTDWDAAHRRPGRIGAFLRATSLDELPQLWNVLVGDMSLVGPRPERDHFVQQFTERYDTYPDRHRVPAGLTGLAQIHGLRGDTSIDDRSRFDNAYVERWSLWNDTKILLRTGVAMVRWRGR